jgi:hypothetical protein
MEGKALGCIYEELSNCDRSFGLVAYRDRHGFANNTNSSVLVNHITSSAINRLNLFMVVLTKIDEPEHDRSISNVHKLF